MTGATLALERRQCGLSQLALAAALGVQPRTLAAWEQRDARLPADLLERISAALTAARQAQARRDLDRFTRLQPSPTSPARSPNP